MFMLSAYLDFFSTHWICRIIWYVTLLTRPYREGVLNASSPSKQNIRQYFWLTPSWMKCTLWTAAISVKCGVSLPVSGIKVEAMVSRGPVPVSLPPLRPMSIKWNEQTRAHPFPFTISSLAKTHTVPDYAKQPSKNGGKDKKNCRTRADVWRLKNWDVL